MPAYYKISNKTGNANKLALFRESKNYLKFAKETSRDIIDLNFYGFWYAATFYYIFMAEAFKIIKVFKYHIIIS